MPASEMAIEGSASVRRKSGKTVPIRPELRAPMVLAHLQESKAALADLELKIAERTLAAIEEMPGGKAKLAALQEQIRAVTFEIDGNAKAHELALRLDKEAASAWRTAILALPFEQLLQGLDQNSCPALCSPDLCVISGLADRCLNPRDGNLPPGMSGNTRLRQIHHAAAEKLRIERIKKQ
jgi:hypothetical protein